MADHQHGSLSPDDHRGGREAQRPHDRPNQADATTIHQRPASALQSPATPRSLRSELRVRTNGVSSVGTMLDAASRTSKIILACSLTLMAAQIVATSCVLALTPARPIDDPFRTFLVAYMLRSLLAAPFQVIRRLRPRRRRQHQTASASAAEQDLEASGSAAEPSPARQSPDGAVGDRYDPNPSSAPPAGGGTGTRSSAVARRTSAPAAAAAAAPRQPRDVEWSNETHERFARARSIVDLTGSILFVWGNYLLLQSSNGVSPPVWNLTLTWVILGYLVVMIPVLLGAAVIFCLPCALVAMRLMRVAEFAGTGAEESEIKRLPVVKYRRRPPPADVSLAASASSQNLVNSAQPRTKRKWLRKLFGRKKVSQQAGSDEGEENFLTLPDEDAVCVICLAEYEDGEELRKLLCGHHFHTVCADEWLRLNRTCPLCKRDIGVSPDAPAAAAGGDPSVPAGSTGVS